MNILIADGQSESHIYEASVHTAWKCVAFY